MQIFLFLLLTIGLSAGACTHAETSRATAPVIIHPADAPVFFGITAAELPPAMRAELGELLPNGAGLGVAAVSRFGPAEEAGIRPADIILNVAGKPVSGKPSLLALLQNRRPGEAVPVTVLRSGRLFELTLTLGRREGTASRQSVSPSKSTISNETFDVIMRLQSLTAYQLSRPQPDMARVYAALGRIRTLATGGDRGEAHIYLRDAEGSLEIRGNEKTAVLIAGKTGGGQNANVYDLNASSSNPLPDAIRRRLARFVQ